MDIEYRVKDGRELKILEEAMDAFPCSLGEIGIRVQKTLVNDKTVEISPVSGDIREIKGMMDKVTFKSLEYASDNPHIFLSSGNYTYFIHLKPSKREA
jgi:hypothetical protein